MLVEGDRLGRADEGCHYLAVQHTCLTSRRAWPALTCGRPLDAGLGLLHAQTRDVPHRNLEPDWLVQGDDEAHTGVLDPVA